MKQKEISPVRLLLRWAGPEKKWLIGSVLCAFGSGLLAITAYLGLYRLMDAVLSGAWHPGGDRGLRRVRDGGHRGADGAAGGLRGAVPQGAYGALFRVRCMVTEHLAKVPLGALDERSTGAVKTVLNEDIEKLELFLAHNLPEFVAYLTGPVVIFLYLLSVNVPLALVSLLPLPLAGIVMGVIFGRMKGILEDANRLPGELQLGNDRVCLRDAAHQGVQHGEPVVSEVFPRHFGGKPDLESGDP